MHSKEKQLSKAKRKDFDKYFEYCKMNKIPPIKVIDAIKENTDNYTWKVISCTLKPIPIAFESFTQGDFDLFLFLFYLHFYKCYMIEGVENTKYSLDDFFGIGLVNFYNKELAKKFAREIKQISYANESDMHKSIITEINKGSRVIVPGDLYYLYYDGEYLKTHHDHYFLIKGYDAEKQLYFILDTSHVDGGANAKYKDFKIEFCTLSKLSEGYARYICGVDKFFLTIRESEQQRNFTYLDAVNEYIDVLQMAYDENITIRNVVYDFFNKTLSEGELDLENLLKFTNLRTVFHDALFKYLRKLNLDNDYINKLESEKDILEQSTQQLKSMLLYNYMKKEKNYNLVVPFLEKNQAMEKAFGKNLINFLSKVNYKELLLDRSNLTDNSVFFQKNNTEAVIEQSSNKVQMFHTENKINNIWIAQDDAPQVLTKLEIMDNFSFETKVNIYNKTNTGYSDEFVLMQCIQSGLIIRFEDNSKILFGNEQGAVVSVCYPEKDIEHRYEYSGNKVYLKITNCFGEYKFYYKENIDDEWMCLPSIMETAKCVSFGMFSKTWGNIGAKVVFEDFEFSIDQ